MKTNMTKMCVWLLIGTIVFFSGCTIDNSPESGTDTTTTVTTAATTMTTTTTTATEAVTTTAPTVNPDMGKVAAQDFTVNIAGVEVNLLDDPTALFAALGEPERTEEKVAGGYWVDHTKNYYYSSVWVAVGVYTDGTEKLDRLFLVDDKIALNKGVKVGCTKEDLIAAYGAPEEDNVRETYIQYHLDIGDVMYTLFFSFENAEDNTVDQIQIGSDFFSL